MNRSRLLAAAAFAIVAASSPVLAQGLHGPAELPPPTFQGMQYVDSAGCAFVRAGVSGNVVWVPRVNRDRSQICGQPPSFGGGAPLPQVVEAPAPAPAPAPVAEPPRAVAAVTPPARPAEAAPIETIASLPSAAAPAAAAPEAPRGISLAQACQGRSGIQPGLVNAATGQPIDCGPGVAPVAVAAPVAAPAAPAPLTLAQVCAGRTGPLPGYVNAATGQPVSCGPVAPVLASVPVNSAAPAAPATLTLAQVCAGRTGPLPGYVTSTGQPVICGPAAAPALTYADADTCPPGVVGGVAYRCGGAGRIDPLSSQTLSLAGVARAAEQPSALGWGQDIPASNPVGAPQVTRAPAGFAQLWDDGRLNPERGLTSASPAAAAAAEQPRMVARAPVPQTVAAPAVVAAAHAYVQVGTYGDPANAQRAVATLQAMGLPAATQAITSNGRAMTIVAAGPFGDAGALSAALNAARSAGYSDAFTR